MEVFRLNRIIRTANRRLREVRMVANALKSSRHPILAHIIPTRRCNLACAYCNEYDAVSDPVPVEEMFARIDRLADLGTAIITLSGGEPLLHPAVVEIIRHIRKRGSIAELITNGYLLNVERIRQLNEAGLDHMQISIDNAEPDSTSKKSLKVLDRKLEMLAEHAEFDVNINSVVGRGMAHAEDALTIARRARQLGLTSTVGIIHNHKGQLQLLGEAEYPVYQQLTREAKKKCFNFERYNVFQRNLSRGLPNEWQCRAGSRYLYICEDGLVHWCSQQRGYPGISIHEYTQDDLDKEYTSIKPCAPYCTISCVHRVSVVDHFRQNPEAALAQFFPPRPGERTPDLPRPVRVLTWMFLPSNSGFRARWIGRTFLKLLRVR